MLSTSIEGQKFCKMFLMHISRLSITPTLILRLEFYWVGIYVGTEILVYITADSVHSKQYNSVRLIIGQSVHVNGSIQYSFLRIQRMHIS